MKRALFALLLLCAGCAGAGPADREAWLARKRISIISPERFEHCHGYGCRLRTIVEMDKTEWKAVSKIMKKTKDAQSERENLAKAIGRMEEIIGRKAGTGSDAAGTYAKLGNDQHDCVDESLNTTIYLMVLEQNGLLLHHRAGIPQARVFPFSRALGPHQSAVITEIETGKRFAVDSWFHDNGQPAEIVALDQWFYGWRPEKEQPKGR